MTTDWQWDHKKATANRLKHGLSFDLARLVFHDPYLLSVPDPHVDDERWQTVGKVGDIIVFVVHTAPEYDEINLIEVGRIISARKATASERRIYEDG